MLSEISLISTPSPLTCSAGKDGHVVGGVGVSGAASALQDEELAQAGAAAISSRASMAVGTSGTLTAATYLPHARVEAAFAKGAPLLENSEFKIHASRRERDGQAEIHLTDTDIV